MQKILRTLQLAVVLVDPLHIVLRRWRQLQVKALGLKTVEHRRGIGAGKFFIRLQHQGQGVCRFAETLEQRHRNPAQAIAAFHKQVQVGIGTTSVNITQDFHCNFHLGVHCNPLT